MSEKNRQGIVLLSEAPFQNAMEPLNKGYYLLGGVGFILGLFGDGLGGGMISLLFGLFLWWIVKANIALAKWRNLRQCEFVVKKDVSDGELMGKLIVALTPYGLRVDLSGGAPSIPYKNVIIKVVHNSNGTFSLPWSQHAGLFFLDYRYITSYKNTVFIMSIVGYQIQKIMTELELAQSDPSNKQEGVAIEGAVEKKKICPNCGSKTELNNKFCNSCGAVLEVHHIAPEVILASSKPKRIKGIFLAVVGIVVLLLAVGVIFVNQESKRTDIIDSVKKTCPADFPDITYGEAFDLYFKDSKWQYIKDETGNKVVQFDGTVEWEGITQTLATKICIQFTDRINENYMEIDYMDIGGVLQDANNIMEVITSIFENAYSAKGLPLSSQANSLVNIEPKKQPDKTSEGISSEYVKLIEGTYIFDDGSSIYSTAKITTDSKGQRIDIEAMGYGGHQQGFTNGYLKRVREGTYSCVDENGNGSILLKIDEDGFTVTARPSKDAKNMLPNVEGHYVYGSDTDTDIVNYDEQETMNDYNIILPDSSEREISVDEIEEMTSEQLRMAINEIYARYGRKFKDAELQAWFDAQSWYSGTIEPEDFNDNVLSPLEKRNISLLQQRRDIVDAADNELSGIYIAENPITGITTTIVIPSEGPLHYKEVQGESVFEYDFDYGTEDNEMYIHDRSGAIYYSGGLNIEPDGNLSYIDYAEEGPFTVWFEKQ